MQEKFLEKAAKQESIRLSVRSICLQNSQILVQKPSDDVKACYAFIGGKLEFGELMDERLKEEYQEEIGIETKILEYLFVVENRFQFNGKLIHGIEHYFHTAVEDTEIISREPHLTHHWIPTKHLKNYDVRPTIVRDAIFDGSWKTAKRLIVHHKE